MYSHLKSFIFYLHGYGSRVQSVETIHIPEQDQHHDWRLGVLGFHAFNTVPNVTEENNLFTYWTSRGTTSAHLPVGIYNIDDLAKLLQDQLPEDHSLTILANNNTQRISLYTSANLDFRPPTSPGRLLGFPPQVLQADTWHTSSEAIELLHYRLIRLHCNIVAGTFHQTGQPSDILHEFSPTSPPGYKIIEEPRNSVYVPINTPTIPHITIDITDEQNRPLNFGNSHRIDVRVHLLRWD
jgi:hypothetical protein